LEKILTTPTPGEPFASSCDYLCHKRAYVSHLAMFQSRSC